MPTKKSKAAICGQFLDIEALVDKLAMSRSAIYRSIKRGALPKPIKVNQRVARWSEAQVDAAMARLAQSGAR